MREEFVACNILHDRFIVDERVYDNEFDDVKTEAGKREVPFDRHGVILAAVQRMWARNTKFRKPEDLVFSNVACQPDAALRGAFRVARDNMGHSGSTGSITLDVYSKTWWEERVDAVPKLFSPNLKLARIFRSPLH